MEANLLYFMSYYYILLVLLIDLNRILYCVTLNSCVKVIDVQ